MKIFTRGMAALLALVMLFCMAACGSSELRTEIDSLKESVSELAAENEQLKQQAIEAKEELANQKAALEALKQDTEETLKNLEAALKGQFRIKVVDLDGEVLVDDAVLCKDAGSIVELLTESYGMVSYQSAYGTSVVSIAGSIVDSNYYVSISENGLYSEVGIDGLVIDVGDVFEFKVECWNTVASGYGTMDEYDLLVDQLIYSYMKTVLPAQVAAETAHTGMLFWDQAAVTFMAKSGYDTNLFCFAYSEEYKNALNAVDVTKLSGSDFMKYYYAKVSMGQELSQSFKDAFNATVATSCTDWLLPVAKAMGSDTQGVQSLIAGAPTTSFEWGPDASICSYVLRGLYANYDGYLASYTQKLDWGNGTSTALLLLAFAKDGINPRQTAYEKDGKDVVEVLLDTYYDKELNLIKVYPTDTGLNFSTNQIYASLMAYKACRDTGNAANIFA